MTLRSVEAVRGARVAGGVRRLSRLLTWKRARNYACGLCALYLVLWSTVMLRSAPPLNGNGEPIGGDYIAFYTAGRLLLAGQGATLYDVATVRRVQDGLLDGRIPRFHDAFRNPPFFAGLFAPLALAPLVASALVWTLVSAALLALALRLGLDEAPLLRRRWRGIAVLTCAFPPVFFCLLDGQNSTLSLLLYVLIYRALARGQDLRAGLWAALGLFKPQLFLVFPIILAASRRWRALRACGGVAAALGVVSLIVVGPDGVVAWLRVVVSAENTNAAGNAWRMHSLRTFFDLVTPGLPLAGLGATALVSAALLAVVARLWASQRAAAELPILWATTSLVAVVVDPHIVDYDLTVLVFTGLLVLPGVPALRWPALLLYGLLLVRAQLPLGDLALQLSVPVLLYGAYRLWRVAQLPAGGVRPAPVVAD